MKNNLKKSEEQIKEIQDITTFADCYIPTICEKIYNLYGFYVFSALLSNLVLTAEHYQNVEKCLYQVRGYFRMVNSHYPLDLSVYEDTKSGRVLIVTNCLRIMSEFRYQKSKEPENKEDVELTPLKSDKK